MALRTFQWSINHFLNSQLNIYHTEMFSVEMLFNRNKALGLRGGIFMYLFTFRQMISVFHLGNICHLKAFEIYLKYHLEY